MSAPVRTYLYVDRTLCSTKLTVELAAAYTHTLTVVTSSFHFMLAPTEI